MILGRVKSVELVFRDLPAVAVLLSSVGLVSHLNVANERLISVMFGCCELQLRVGQVK